MNTEETLALLWKIEAAAAAGEPVPRRQSGLLVRALIALPSGALRQGLLHRFTVQGRDEPGPIERFRWADRDRLFRPATIEAALEVLQQHPCQPIGRGHSGTPDQGPLLDLEGLKRVERVEDAHPSIDTARLIRAQAGLTLAELVRTLEPEDLVPFQLGGALEQSLAGAIHTGAHAPGRVPLADAVVSVDVLLDGEVQRFEPTEGITDPLRCPLRLIQDDAAFAAMVVNRGRIGVSVAFTLVVEDVHFVEERTRSASLAGLDRILERVGKGERLALTVRPQGLWVHRYQEQRRHQVPQDAWDEPAELERRTLPALEDALGPELVGWLADLCPNASRALFLRQSRPKTRLARSWLLDSTPSVTAWRLTRETCALDDLRARLEAWLPTAVHPIRVVFAEPTPRHTLLPDEVTATIELRTPLHLPAPELPAEPEPPIRFVAQQQLRTRAASPLPETLILKGLQGDLPDDEAERLQSLMQDGARFAATLRTVLPDPGSSRGLRRWEDWLGGNRRRVERERVGNFGDLLRVLALRGSKLIRAHGKHHADNWVSAPAEGSIAINLMEDWKNKGPKKDQLETWIHQGETYARAFGWERLGGFFERLKEKDLAVLNTGSFTGQSIAGPLSVATHGSGVAFGAMADSVVEIDILCADGRVRRIRRRDWPKRTAPVDMPGIGNYFPHSVDLPFELAVVNLGCFGIVLSYVIQVTTTYRLQQKTSVHPLDEGLQVAEQLNADPNVRHVELVMVPEPIELQVEDPATGQRVTRACQVALIERSIPSSTTPNTKKPGLPFPANLVPHLDRQGQSQVGKLVQNVGWIRRKVMKGALTSQKPFVHDWEGVLIRDTGVYAHGFEIHVPVEHLVAAAKAVNAGIVSAAAQGTHPSAPVGVRFVKAGAQAMAMNHEQLDDHPVAQWCTFEVPRLLGSNRNTLIVGRILYELVTRNVPFRPHWGQYFPEDLAVASRYPRLGDWLDAREQLDPTGAFFPPRLKARLTPGRGIEAAALGAPVQGGRRALVVLPPHAVPSGHWQKQFEAALRRGLAQRYLPAPQLVWLRTDDLFNGRRPDPIRVRQALLDGFGGGSRYHLDRRRSALGRLPEDPDWQPTDLAAWLTDAEVREQVRIRISNALADHAPQVVIAHGTAALFAYDSFTHAGSAPRSPVDLVTLASPAAHPSLRRLWGGSLPRPRHVRYWLNAYHRDDPFFVGSTPRSDVYDVELRESTALPHAPGIHVEAGAVVRDIWSVVFGDALPRHRARLDARRHRRRARKALLVGIDTYAEPSFADLEGSVNDALAMSELLQSHYGYRAEDIRILTDQRATTDALRDRLEWLLAGTTSLDQRVFYFSGHGTQLPAYNALEVVDRVDECLVTHDFDWQFTDRAFVDDDFMELYSQLPHGARFTAIFDCCHAAGMSRAGGGQVRGIGLPEDVLHRMRRFAGGTWRFRATQSRANAVREPTRGLAQGLLGAASGLRPTERTRDTDPAVRGHSGPFLPVLMYATREQDLAYEYREGRQVRGAFSWALTEALARDPNPTYATLLQTVRDELEGVVGFQRPDLEGPSARLDREPSDRQGTFDL